MAIGNFLTSIIGTSGHGLPRPIQSIDPNSALDPIAMGQQPDYGPSPMDLLADAQTNYTPQIVDQAPVVSSAPAPMSSTPARQPRERVSALDTIGGIADVLARVGGAEALYQPSIDAREDRARQIDLEALKHQILEQQVQQGAAAPQEQLRNRLGTALGAVASSGNPLAAWSQINPEDIGLDPQRYEAIRQRIEANPESASVIARSLGWAPPQQGSLPAAIQNFERFRQIEQELGPEAAEQFRRFAQPSEFGNPLEYARLQQSQSQFETEMGFKERQAAAADAKGAGGTLTPTQRGNVAQKIKMLPSLEAQLTRVDELNDALNDSYATGFFGGRVPGALAGGTENSFDKAVASLQDQLRQFTRIPGEGSVSNYEQGLIAAPLPARSDTPEGRAQALQDLRSRVQFIRQGYEELSGPSGGRKPPPPRNRPAAPRSGTTSSGVSWRVVQ